MASLPANHQSASNLPLACCCSPPTTLSLAQGTRPAFFGDWVPTFTGEDTVKTRKKKQSLAGVACLTLARTATACCTCPARCSHSTPATTAHPAPARTRCLHTTRCSCTHCSRTTRMHRPRLVCPARGVCQCPWPAADSVCPSPSASASAPRLLSARCLPPALMLFSAHPRATVGALAAPRTGFVQHPQVRQSVYSAGPQQRQANTDYLRSRETLENSLNRLDD